MSIFLKHPVLKPKNIEGEESFGIEILKPTKFGQNYVTGIKDKNRCFYNKITHPGLQEIASTVTLC